MSFLRRRFLLVGPLLAALVIGATVAAIRLNSRGAAVPATRATIVARVGDTAIPDSVFQGRLRTVIAGVRQAGGPQPGSPAYAAFLRNARARVLQSLIVDAVIAEEADFRGVAATDRDVEAEVSAEASAAGGLDRLQIQLADAGGSLDQLRDAIRSRLNEQRLEDLFARQRAADILSQLNAGAGFAALASQLSDDDQSRSRGGDVGGLSPDQLKAADSAFASAVAALQPGQTTTTPVRDDAGYEILRLDSVTGGTRHLRRILVAAPRVYTVSQRPAWFTQSVFSAIAQDCARGRITVYLTDAGQPCATAASPSPGRAP